MHRLLAFIALVFAFMAPVQAQDCANLEQVRADVAKWSFPVVMTAMDAKASASFLSAYNREAPTSELEGDLVVAISAQEKTTVYTLFFPKQKFINLIAGDRI